MKSFDGKNLGNRLINQKLGKVGKVEFKSDANWEGEE